MSVAVAVAVAVAVSVAVAVAAFFSVFLVVVLTVHGVDAIGVVVVSRCLAVGLVLIFGLWCCLFFAIALFINLICHRCSFVFFIVVVIVFVRDLLERSCPMAIETLCHTNFSRNCTDLQHLPDDCLMSFQKLCRGGSQPCLP